MEAKWRLPPTLACDVVGGSGWKALKRPKGLRPTEAGGEADKTPFGEEPLLNPLMA